MDETKGMCAGEVAGDVAHLERVRSTHRNICNISVPELADD